MRAAKLQAWAGSVALAVACLLIAPTPRPVAAVSPAPADEWLDTIRAPLRDEGPAAACPGVGTLAFEPGRAEPTVDGRRSLDALAVALTSADLGQSRFAILWLANDGAPADLAERRAAAIEAGLRSHPPLVPERLTVSRAQGGLDGCSRTPALNDLLLQVRIAGRWWGGQ